MIVEPASSAVVPASVLAWAVLLGGLQVSGVATRGVRSASRSGTGLSAADRLRWDVRVVSTVHALLLVLGAHVQPEHYWMQTAERRHVIACAERLSRCWKDHTDHVSATVRTAAMRSAHASMEKRCGCRARKHR